MAPKTQDGTLFDSALLLCSVPPPSILPRSPCDDPVSVGLSPLCLTAHEEDGSCCAPLMLRGKRGGRKEGGKGGRRGARKGREGGTEGREEEKGRGVRQKNEREGG